MIKYIITAILLNILLLNPSFANEYCTYEVISKKYNTIKYLKNWNDENSYAFLSDTFNSKTYKFSHVLVVNWNETNFWNYEFINQLVFSDDLKNYLFVMSKDKKESIIHNWKIIWTHEYIWSIVFSDDWKNIAFIFEDNKQYFVMKNNNKSKSYQYIYGLNFDSENKISFIWKRENKYYFVNDWIESKWFDKIENFTHFNFSNKSLFTGIIDGSSIFYYSWKEISPLELWLIYKEEDIYNKNVSNNKNKLFLVNKEWKKWIEKKDCSNNQKLILLENKIKKSKYSNIIPKINNFLDKISRTKLELVNEKLKKIDENNEKYNDIKDIIIYLKMRIEIKLSDSDF